MSSPAPLPERRLKASSFALMLGALMLAALALGGCVVTGAERRTGDGSQGDVTVRFAYLNSGGLNTLLNGPPPESGRVDTGRSDTALGFMYLTGSGVPRDPRRAFMLFQAGAAAGDLAAADQVGVFYRVGTLVPRNDAYARQLFTSAMAAGVPPAFAHLGEMEEAGLGTGRADAGRALALYRQGMAAGDLQAGIDYRRLTTALAAAEAAKKAAPAMPIPSPSPAIATSLPPVIAPVQAQPLTVPTTITTTKTTVTQNSIQQSVAPQQRKPVSLSPP